MQRDGLYSLFPCIDEWSEIFGSSYNLYINKADLGPYEIFMTESIHINERQECYFIRENTNSIFGWIHYGVNTQILFVWAWFRYVMSFSEMQYSISARFPFDLVCEKSQVI